MSSAPPEGIEIRRAGRAGRITLRRPQALNALTPQMPSAVLDALDAWAADDGVALVLLDAEGDRAFCAGGDLTAIYRSARGGDLDPARAFWRTEYRMNARLAAFPKPVVSLMHGYVMGGGVGLGCHGSHRVVCETSRIAMPEVGLGLIPDVGGTALLARAPGHLGEYLALTAARMGPDDAIRAGFADRHVPQAEWPALTEALERDGRAEALAEAATAPGSGPLQAAAEEIDRSFAAADPAALPARLARSRSELAADAAQRIEGHAPLAMAAAIRAIRQLRGAGIGRRDIRPALRLEYRFVHRAIAQVDFLEGIRARIIDKDRMPRWAHASLASVTAGDVEAMLAPLGDDEWQEASEAAA